jgi:hypothetical protein
MDATPASSRVLACCPNESDEINYAPVAANNIAVVAC